MTATTNMVCVYIKDTFNISIKSSTFFKSLFKKTSFDKFVSPTQTQYEKGELDDDVTEIINEDRKRKQQYICDNKNVISKNPKICVQNDRIYVMNIVAGRNKIDNLR